MVFTIRCSGERGLHKATQAPGDRPVSILSIPRRAAFLIALALGVSAAQPSLAQTVNQSANLTASNAAQASMSPASAAAALLAGSVPHPVPHGVAPLEQGDAVTRFLTDKGLMPNTRPVVELAQQVRDKATDVASELVMSAMNFLGVRYKRGGNSRESGFDCSGFTRHVFENSVGLILPRRASEQATSPALMPVQKSELKPGDLVFFNTLRRTFSHVGIYIGDDKFIHSPRAGGSVRVEDMRQSYWQQRYDGARRAPVVAGQQMPTPGN
jgi:cell wall-associated NlpC family hydrolase